MIWGASIAIALGLMAWFQRNRVLNEGQFRLTKWALIALPVTVVLWAAFGGLIGFAVDWFI